MWCPFSTPSLALQLVRKEKTIDTVHLLLLLDGQKHWCWTKTCLIEVWLSPQIFSNERKKPEDFFKKNRCRSSVRWYSVKNQTNIFQHSSAAVQPYPQFAGKILRKSTFVLQFSRCMSCSCVFVCVSVQYGTVVQVSTRNMY